MYKIVVDCFGGDNSPKANVSGAVMAINAESGFELLLVGDENKIKQELSTYKYDQSRVQIVHASEVITCEEQPTVAIKSKPDSSMVKSFWQVVSASRLIFSRGNSEHLGQHTS